MRNILTASADFFKKLIFDGNVKFAVSRCIAVSVFAVLVVINPFVAAHWLRGFMYLFSFGIFLMILSGFKLKRKIVLLFIAAFLLSLAALYYGRGDAVSGLAIALICGCTGVSLLIVPVRENRYILAFRIFCAIAAFAVAIAIVCRCGQLGVRYLDQLHSYALALAGCAFSNLLLIKKEYR